MKRIILTLVGLVSLVLANDDMMIFSLLPGPGNIKDTHYIRISDIDSIRFNNLPLGGLLANYPFNFGLHKQLNGDISGSNKDATIIKGNAATYTIADRFKIPYKALLLFSDSAQYVRIPNLINGLTAFSISIWFCPDSINPWRWIFGQYPTPKVGGVSVGATLNNGRLRYHIRTSGTDTIKPFDGAATDMVRNKWYHLAVVYTGNFFSAYLNGKTDGTVTATGAVASPDSLALGAGSFSGNKELFRGILDDVRVYNRSLTVAEITALYREGGYIP